MPGSEIPSGFTKARMTEIADLIKILPQPKSGTEHNSITLGLAEEIFDLMPKTHAKRAKMVDKLTLSKQLAELASLCREEGRPGHCGPIRQGKRSFERSSV